LPGFHEILFGYDKHTLKAQKIFFGNSGEGHFAFKTKQLEYTYISVMLSDGNYERKFFTMSDFKEKNFIRAVKALDGLILYRSVLSDPVICHLRNIFTRTDRDSGFSDDANVRAGIENDFSNMIGLLVESAENFGYGGDIFKNYMLNLFLYNENKFSLYCENNKNVQNTSLYKFALNDIKILKSVLSIELSSFCGKNESMAEIFDYKPVNPKENGIPELMSYAGSEEKLLELFVDFYNVSGCGNISRFRCFKYDDSLGKIIGIDNPDPITFDDIIGYKSQTETLIDNTEAFIKGFPANNVLLVGSRGTGKSSSVKALANKYCKDGLRIIEITKEQVTKLTKLLEMLKNRGRRFIVFIDDLSFDEREVQYKYMKSLIEGGSQSKPDNVLFYATSNRRHLISEKWSDRQRGSDDGEIHTQDTLNEKLSLADRFGITISYPKPTPSEYVNMVRIMADKCGISLDDEVLEKEALKWEINQKGISGRTARQFVNHLAGRLRQFG